MVYKPGSQVYSGLGLRNSTDMWDPHGIDLAHGVGFGTGGGVAHAWRPRRWHVGSGAWRPRVDGSGALANDGDGKGVRLAKANCAFERTRRGDLGDMVGITGGDFRRTVAQQKWGRWQALWWQRGRAVIWRQEGEHRVECETRSTMVWSDGQGLIGGGGTQRLRDGRGKS